MNSTIETYINGRFSNLPKTSELERARQELLQMSEDKYVELTSAGVSPDDATGRVITEFGDLNELADDLGIRDALEQSRYVEKRHLLNQSALAMWFGWGLIAIAIVNFIALYVLTGRLRGAILSLFFIAIAALLLAVSGLLRRRSKRA